MLLSSSELLLTKNLNNITFLTLVVMETRTINKTLLPCPKCRIKAAEQVIFGKKARCLNCGHLWILRWRGGRTFSNRSELK